MKQLFIIWTILLTFILWYLMFVIQPFNFWLMMSISTLLLAAFAWILGRPLMRKNEWNRRNIGMGLLSAAILYGVFWMGHQVLLLAENILPLLSHRAENLSAIYANRGELPALWNALLLFFPIGFSEELYWRGLVQKHFTTRMSGLAAFLLAATIYTAVHIPTGNVVLILAALVCGIFWGGLYLWSGSLVPVLISHMVWDPLIFVIFPIH